MAEINYRDLGSRYGLAFVADCIQPNTFMMREVFNIIEVEKFNNALKTIKEYSLGNTDSDCMKDSHEFLADQNFNIHCKRLHRAEKISSILVFYAIRKLYRGYRKESMWALNGAIAVYNNGYNVDGEASRQQRLYKKYMEAKRNKNVVTKEEVNILNPDREIFFMGEDE